MDQTRKDVDDAGRQMKVRVENGPRRRDLAVEDGGLPDGDHLLPFGFREGAGGFAGEDVWSDEIVNLVQILVPKR